MSKLQLSCREIFSLPNVFVETNDSAGKDDESWDY